MKSAILIGILLLLSSVVAVDPGDILTQTQIDNFNASKITWNFLKCSDAKHFWRDAFNYHNDYYCMDLDEYNESHYIVENNSYYTTVSIRLVEWCKSIRSVEFCRQRYSNEITRQALQTPELIKAEFIRYKTNESIYETVGYMNETQGDQGNTPIGGDTGIQTELYSCNEIVQQECFGISGGKHTRCYKNPEHTNWWYCSSGWVIV